MPVGTWDPGSYLLVRWLLLRGLALVYLIAFLVAARQFRPLAGVDGLLPLDNRLDRRRFRDAPSLFQVVRSDRTIGIAAWMGVGLSLLAMVGIPGLLESGGVAIAAHVALWGLLWALYLSFVNAGGVFYGFGWESMLCEAGFLAIFLGPPQLAAPAIVIWLFRWLLVRNMLGAGLIKLRGDDCWRDLTCLDYHYETQPMPNPVSWLTHHLPARLHRAGVTVNHVVEVLIPFLYVAPQPVAAAAGVVTIGFQGWLMVTGNFAWLNLLTIVLAVSTFADPLLLGPLSITAPSTAPIPTGYRLAIWGLVVVVLVLSYWPVKNLVSDRQAMNAAFDPLKLVNTYGAFGSITRTRHELVVEGTTDERPTEETTWRAYEIPGKPTAIDRRPPQIAPYHHRLGWQLWFAAMSPTPRRHPWLYPLLGKLLEADPGVRSLLESDPFGDEPPTHVRVIRYRYRFTTPAERAESGDWWHREPVGTYVEPVSLEDPSFQRILSRFGWEKR